MDFKDYAGYYIGCRCFNTWFLEDHEEYDRDWILRGVCNNVTSYYKSFLLENDDDFTWTDSIKLILRKLEDVSHEEWNELERQTSIRKDAYGLNTFESYFVTNTPTTRPPWQLLNEMLILLRKNDIDVDGLIKNGLAVDSKTLK